MSPIVLNPVTSTISGTAALTIVNKVLRDYLRLSTVTTIEGSSVRKDALTVLEMINRTQRWISGRILNFDFLKKQGEITLATSTAKYGLATDFKRVLDKEAFYYKNSDGTIDDTNIITLIDDKTFRNHQVSNEVVGLPYAVRIFGFSGAQAQLEVIGTPTSTYNGTKMYYDYIMKPAELALDEDVSVVPEDILILGAVYYFKEQNGLASQKDWDDYEDSYKSHIMNERRTKEGSFAWPDF